MLPAQATSLGHPVVTHITRDPAGGYGLSDEQCSARELVAVIRAAEALRGE